MNIVERATEKVKDTNQIMSDHMRSINRLYRQGSSIAAELADLTVGFHKIIQGQNQVISDLLDYIEDLERQS